MSLSKSFSGSAKYAFLLLAGLLAGTAAAPLSAQEADKPAATHRHMRKHGPAQARPAGSLEERHQVCLSFIRRHGLECDPWQTPTCGADTGYFRPPECVRPRSQ